MYLKRTVKNATIWLSKLFTVWSVIQLHLVQSNVLSNTPSHRPIESDGNRIINRTRQPSILLRQHRLLYTPQPQEQLAAYATQANAQPHVVGPGAGLSSSNVFVPLTDDDQGDCDDEPIPAQPHRAQQLYPIHQPLPIRQALPFAPGSTFAPIVVGGGGGGGSIGSSTNKNHNDQTLVSGARVDAGNLYTAKSKGVLDLGKESLRRALLSLQNPHLFGGDILIRLGGRKILPASKQDTPKQGMRPAQVSNQPTRLIKFERSALVSSISLWPEGKIYYELDTSVFHLRELILKVMQQFHEETCVRFVPRLNNEPDFLRIEALKGCFSYIGRIGGEQTLSLGDGCEYRGTIAHELLHSVGFYHHQNRSDRDDFLEIVWDNIARGKESQFYKMSPQENILLNEFDYNSIMLYGPRTFGKTLDKVTMKPKRDGVILLEVVEKQGLSTLDANSVNKLYRCESVATS